MIGKLIAHGNTREEALQRMVTALDGFGVAGIETNMAFLRALLRHPHYVQANVNTSWVENNLGSLVGQGL